LNAEMTGVGVTNLPPGIGQRFDATLALLDGLSRAMDRLDEELLAGRPHAIAEATLTLEAGLADSQAGFESFRKALGAAGDGGLGAAARRLHQSSQPELGLQLDRIGMQLLSLARRSGAGLRRAEALGAGLSSSLQALRALDVLGRDQLLAEA
jgi:hypothetical protein